LTNREFTIYVLKKLLALNLERFGARCGQFTGELVAED